MAKNLMVYIQLLHTVFVAIRAGHTTLARHLQRQIVSAKLLTTHSKTQ